MSRLLKSIPRFLDISSDIVRKVRFIRSDFYLLRFALLHPFHDVIFRAWGASDVEAFLTKIIPDLSRAITLSGNRSGRLVVKRPIGKRIRAKIKELLSQAQPQERPNSGDTYDPS